MAPRNINENVRDDGAKAEDTFRGVRGSYGQREATRTSDVWGTGRGERVTWEGKRRTGWVASNATCRCSTCLPKMNDGRWQRNNQAITGDHS